MSWFRPKPKLPEIPPSPHWDIKEPAAKEEGIVVDEVDTSAMSRTGIFRAWDRMTGKFKA